MGQVTFFYHDQIENAPAYVVVVLDEGPTVHARAPNNFDFRRGHKAVLNERSTILGSKSYIFIGYAK